MTITNDALRLTFNFLDAHSLCMASQVCKQWRHCESTSNLWIKLFLQDFGIKENTKELYLLFRNSRFNLIHKNIELKSLKDSPPSQINSYPIVAWYEDEKQLNVYNLETSSLNKFPLFVQRRKSSSFFGTVCHVNQSHPTLIFIDLQVDGFVVFNTTLRKVVTIMEAEFDKFVTDTAYLTRNPFSCHRIDEDSKVPLIDLFKGQWWSNTFENESNQGSLGFEDTHCRFDSERGVLEGFDIFQKTKKYTIEDCINGHVIGEILLKCNNDNFLSTIHDVETGNILSSAFKDYKFVNWDENNFNQAFLVTPCERILELWDLKKQERLKSFPLKDWLKRESGSICEIIFSYNKFIFSIKYNYTANLLVFNFEACELELCVERAHPNFIKDHIFCFRAVENYKTIVKFMDLCNCKILGRLEESKNEEYIRKSSYIEIDFTPDPKRRKLDR